MLPEGRKGRPMTLDDGEKEPVSDYQRLASPRRRPPPGSPPGTLVPTADSPPPVLSATTYGPDVYDEHPLKEVEHLGSYFGTAPVTWIDVQGLGDIGVLRRLAGVIGLHSLALEDVVHLHQRAKTEIYEDHLFIVIRLPHAEEGFETEQVSMVLGPDYLVTFQERPGDSFAPVRERLRKRGRIREFGADYLAYALIDALVDSYFPILEDYGERVEALELEVTERPTQDTLSTLHGLKRELLMVRRAIWPLREMTNALLREETPFVDRSTRIYLRDCYDHAVQLMDMLEVYRDISSSLVDIYLSAMSQKTNEIMKVLTIIATIFIPLGFIAGLYGMNFDRVSPYNMPELGWRFGYPLVLLVMAAVAGGLLYFFRRRGWLGGGRR
jgi:magnesium transporter